MDRTTINRLIDTDKRVISLDRESFKTEIEYSTTNCYYSVKINGHIISNADQKQSIVKQLRSIERDFEKLHEKIEAINEFDDNEEEDEDDTSPV